MKKDISSLSTSEICELIVNESKPTNECTSDFISIVQKVESGEGLEYCEWLLLQQTVFGIGRDYIKQFPEYLKTNYNYTLNPLFWLSYFKLKPLRYSNENVIKDLLSKPAELLNVVTNVSDKIKDTYYDACELMSKPEFERAYNNYDETTIRVQIIVKSERVYNTGLKEGFMIKKEPYSSAYIINIYYITGACDFDVSTQTLNGGKQGGIIIRLTNLPTYKDLIDTLEAYEWIKDKTDGTQITNDLKTYKAYKSFSLAYKTDWYDEAVRLFYNSKFREQYIVK